MWLLTTERRKTISAWAQYLYFLRVPIIGWLLLPTLCLLDWKTGVSALTRGIMTMGSGWQAFYAGFFVTSMGMATLVCIRNVVHNGQDRFDSRSPDPLFRFYCSRRRRFMWSALALAHVPTLLTLAYVVSITIWEQEWIVFGPHYGLLFCVTTIGILAAILFWYLVSLFYLWTYPHTVGEEPVVAIFPGDLPFFQLAKDAEKPLFAVGAERLATWLMPLSPEGYRSSRTGRLRELHFLTAVALAGFLVLYLMLYPLKGLAVMLKKHPERGADVHELLSQVTGHELRGEGRVYGGGLNKIEPYELGRISTAPFVERWPELGDSVQREEAAWLFG